MTSSKDSHSLGYTKLYREANRRLEVLATPKRTAPQNRSDDALLALALEGHLVAEELSRDLRHALILLLHRQGWTDQEIAEHTRTTLYTTARIRDYLGLNPNRPRFPRSELAA